MGILILVLIFNFSVGGLATRYVIEFWASYFRREKTTIPFFGAALAGLFIAELTIPIAIGTFLISHFIQNDDYYLRY